MMSSCNSLLWEHRSQGLLFGAQQATSVTQQFHTPAGDLSAVKQTGFSPGVVYLGYINVNPIKHKMIFEKLKVEANGHNA